MQKESMTFPNDCVLVMKNGHLRHSPTVLESWQPEVAQFLLDVYPDALENGVGLSELYHMVAMPELDEKYLEFADLIEQIIQGGDGEDL